jgi:hypothetical protein
MSAARSPATSTALAAGLAGPIVELKAYAASPYQFGVLREEAQPAEPRIVLESYVDAPGEEPARVSLS